MPVHLKFHVAALCLHPRGYVRQSTTNILQARICAENAYTEQPSLR